MRLLNRAAVGRLACLSAIILVCFGTSMAFALPASAYNYVTYCSDQPVNPGDACGGPPGWAWDPQHLYDSYGGWDKNFADYSGTGSPYLWVYTEIVTNNSTSTACSFNNPTLHDINDGGCIANYSWNIGKNVDALAGIWPAGCCLHHISGTGRWP